MRALDAFECVHSLLPITEQAAFQSKRKNVEKPFMLSEKYMVFPEVTAKTVTGFYVYGEGGTAWYYDAVLVETLPQVVKRPLGDLNAPGEHTLYELVAQPSGIETIMLGYMPGFGDDESTSQGPAWLGASVLPVVGAFVSRSNAQLHVVYHNPGSIDEGTLRQWVYDHLSRKPAAVSEVEISRKMMKLATRSERSKAALWQPLQDELQIRKTWLQTHNLDEKAFRNLSKIMQTSCR